MAKAETSTASYLPGEDPETLEANRRYQEALATLTSSLDVRKNRFFDPVLLAMAEGFLSPTQTGSFGESLGKVASKVGPAEAAAAKEEQEIAKQKLAVAAQGLELQRLRARDAELARYLGEGPKSPVAGPQAAPVVGPRAGALTTAAEAPAAAPAPSVGPLTPSEPIPEGQALTFPLRNEPPVEVRELPAGDSNIRLAGPLSAAAPQPAAKPTQSAGALTQVRQVAPQTGATPVASDRPAGFEGVEGIQVAPGNPNFMTARDYIRLNRFDKSKSPGDLIKEAQEVEQKRYRDKEGGVLDLATGKYYQYPTGKTEEIQIHGYPGTYMVDARTAALLSLYASTDDPRYWALAELVVKGPRRPAPAAGGADPAAAPAGLQSKQEIAAAAKETEARAAEVGKKAAEKETSLEDNEANARRVYGSTTRVLDYIKQSPNYFGIFARPNISSAIGTLIREGMQTPSGTLNLAGFEESMRKLMPGVTQKDLDNVTKAATELAEVELAFTRLYLAKQGAVTEGERKIVRAIPGTVSNSPEVLRSRMELLKARSQYDIDVADAFRQWQDKNPGRSYFEFERKSDMYKQIKKDFEAETEKIFGGIKAVPTRQRREEAAQASKPGQLAPGLIRDAQTGEIRRKREGE